MMRIISSLTLLAFSVNVLAQTPVVTVENKKTKEQIKITCITEQCEQFDISHVENEQETLINTLTQEEYAKRMDLLQKKDKLKVSNHFFQLTQGITKLPWDNSEFVLAYFILGLFTIPLTIAAVGVDAVLTPVSTVSFVGDALNGNAGKKMKRKLAKKKDMKISDYRFNTIKRYLE